ncbi:uncharacterized protein LOC129218066 isoform X2 [Uloborus diversus]|uniref:uncharacterized protein LOC129218066 isoform X2 n=1 Tax=Uloborus diversus TaxID=327109 RepID=UPI00240A59AD|nr:uncharacterized protein LOC129218066 isoform X2 [Uloborus diversus]
MWVRSWRVDLYRKALSFYSAGKYGLVFNLFKGVFINTLQELFLCEVLQHGVQSSEEIRKDPRKLLYLKEMYARLREYIGAINMPEQEVVWQIIEKVQYNQLIFNSTVSRSAGRSNIDAVFLCASELEHSCIPNAEFEIVKGSIVVRAIKTIRRREKVFVSYIPAILHPDSHLAESALQTFVSHCQCEDCSKPYGTSVLSKVLDECKASSVENSSKHILNIAAVFEKVGLPLTLKDGTNHVLRCQEGVLGSTHILRIKVLALKVVFLSNSSLEARSDLRALLECMEEAFGEYHREVRLLYFLLLKCNMDLLDILEAFLIKAKIAEFEEMGFESLFS